MLTEILEVVIVEKLSLWNEVLTRLYAVLRINLEMTTFGKRKCVKSIKYNFKYSTYICISDLNS